VFSTDGNFNNTDDGVGTSEDLQQRMMGGGEVIRDNLLDQDLKNLKDAVEESVPQGEGHTGKHLLYQKQKGNEPVDDKAERARETLRMLEDEVRFLTVCEQIFTCMHVHELICVFLIRMDIQIV